MCCFSFLFNDLVSPDSDVPSVFLIFLFGPVEILPGQTGCWLHKMYDIAPNVRGMNGSNYDYDKL